MLRERVNVADFQSDHFAAQLVERLGWAVEDAHEAETEETPEVGSAEASETAEASEPISVSAPA
jgi:hypothetical protein